MGNSIIEMFHWVMALAAKSKNLRINSNGGRKELVPMSCCLTQTYTYFPHTHLSFSIINQLLNQHNEMSKEHKEMPWSSSGMGGEWEVGRLTKNRIHEPPAQG